MNSDKPKCFDHAPVTPLLTVQNGWLPDGRRRMTRIRHAFKDRCVLHDPITDTIQGYAVVNNFNCQGCPWYDKFLKEKKQ